jgi:hypothetical protein
MEYLELDMEDVATLLVDGNLDMNLSDGTEIHLFIESQKIKW